MAPDTIHNMISTATQQELVELYMRDQVSANRPRSQASVTHPSPDQSINLDDETSDGRNVTSAIPDGGPGWLVVFGSAVVTFWINGLINCWGVLQTALLNSTLRNTPTSTLSFVGSLGLACGTAFGILAMHLIKRSGTRITAMLGVVMMGTGLIASGSTISNVAGLFITIGVVAGFGDNFAYTVTNVLPIQYFSGRLGLANGLVKLGGGIGGTVMAIVLDYLVRQVGIEWTFRIQGLLTITTGLPAAWLMKDRLRIRNASVMDLSMFRNLPFTFIFFAGAIGTFSLFIPPYYLPLFAQSLGLSSSTGAAIVSAFNLCNAAGRFLGGISCDKIGPVNTFFLTMLINSGTALALWPTSSSLPPLVAFAVLNGLGNGSFFTTVPTVVASIFGPGRAAVAMSMSITGWTIGYILGTPIAGFLLSTSGQEMGVADRIDVYRPAIFYAGGTALFSCLLVLFVRFQMTREVFKRV